MKQYLDLAKHVLAEGNERGDRTGTGTISVFGPQLHFDLREGFPIVTTKKTAIRLVWTELLWMLQGTSSIRPLIAVNNNIWNDWPMKKWIEDEQIDTSDMLDITDLWKRGVFNSKTFEDKYGDLGPVYGVQWRKWMTPMDGWIDQLQLAIDTIERNPEDRRIIVTAWNPGELEEMALPPCHLLYQFYVEGDWLDVKVYQRSADVFLGLPFDIASYATLLHMVAHVTNKKPRSLIYTLGDTHIYKNHVDQIKEQLTRVPYALPTFNVNKKDRIIKTIDDFRFSDFEFDEYKHHPSIKGDVSV